MLTPMQIIKAAIADEYPDEPMSAADAALYWNINYINLRLKYKEIPQPMATELKKCALREHQARKVKCDAGEEAIRHIAKMYKRTELAASAYRLKPTRENADNLLFAIDDGDLRKEIYDDNSFVSSQD